MIFVTLISLIILFSILMKKYSLWFLIMLVIAIVWYYVYSNWIINKTVQDGLIDNFPQNIISWDQNTLNNNTNTWFVSGEVKSTNNDDILTVFSWVQLNEIYNINNGEYILWISNNTVFMSLQSDDTWWLSWFTIHDTGKECHTWNRPTWFVQSGDKLLMSVLDKCGGWSMEWYVSSYELQQDGKRKLAGCYNYANRDPFEKLAPEEYKDKWYEWWTTQLDQLPEEPLETCEWNIQIQYYM